ncbi:MAG: hypothetical protein LBJ08_03405 [Bifidobacteriaceae bacterium]|jgi:hypothetical protein|nr:hypothetical protein [Bifidobacteriaceae bacterium]
MAIDQFSKRSGTRRDRLVGWAALAVATSALALLGVFGVAARLARIYNDDFRFFADLDQYGTLGFLGQYLSLWNGRYTGAVAIAVGYAVGGVGAIPGLCLVFVLLLALATWYAAGVLLPFNARWRRTGPVVIGLGGAVAAIAAAPSFFDSYLWVSSAMFYVTAVAFSLASAASSVQAWRGGGRWTKAWAIVVLVLAAGCLEPATLVLFVAHSLLLGVVAAKRIRRLAVLEIVSVAVSGGALALMFLAPGASERRGSFARGLASTLTETLSGAVRGVGVIPLRVSLPAWCLAVGLGLVIATAVRWPSRVWAWRALTVAAIGGLVPGIVCSALSAYALGRVPLRTYAVNTAFAAWGIALGVGAIAYLVGDRFPPQLRQRTMAVIGSALFLAGAGLEAEGTVSVIQAESLRAGLVETRDTAVARALEESAPAIEITPAPILISKTSASGDFGFTEKAGQRQAMIRWYRRYMGIPQDTALTFGTQPLGYCLRTQPHPSTFALTCDDLGKER